MSIDHAPLVPSASRFTSTSPAQAPTVPVDAYRHGDVLILRCDLPGVDPDSIEVAIDEGKLLVQAERTWLPSPNDEVLLSERPCGAMYRAVPLPEDVDPTNALADFDGGVLTVTVPYIDQIPAPHDGLLTLPPEDDSVPEPPAPLRDWEGITRPGGAWGAVRRPV